MPSWYTPNKTRDNRLTKGEINLDWVHGFQCIVKEDEFECRNMCAIIQLPTDKSYRIIYSVAQLGVIFNKKDNSQSYLRGHTN